MSVFSVQVNGGLGVAAPNMVDPIHLIRVTNLHWQADESQARGDPLEKSQFALCNT